jgi:y4mF family transcriptional regulator
MARSGDGADRREPPDGGRLAALAGAVRRRRRELGLRQAELAELAGCSQRFVHTVEQGKPTLRLDKVLDVLEVLGLGLVVVPGRGALGEPAEGPPWSGEGR